MVLHEQRTPLRLEDRPAPNPGPGQVLLRVRACAVCRTDLHIVDGELTRPKLPLILGHQIVGAVEQGAQRFAAGARVGVGWLGWTDGTCRFCRSGRENLCDAARFTGYDLDGGYAEYAVADERYCFPLPDSYDDPHAAPLLCAGLIGYRTLRLAGDAERIGLYGFGAAAHLIAQVATHQGRRVFAFTRPGDAEGQGFARQPRRRLGGRLGREAARGAGRRAHLRAGRRAHPGGAAGGEQRWHGRRRRHPHERHPRLPLRAALGRAQRALRREPHPARRRGAPPHRRPDEAARRGAAFPARTGQRGAPGPARWSGPRGRRAGSVNPRNPATPRTSRSPLADARSALHASTRPAPAARPAMAADPVPRLVPDGGTLRPRLPALARAAHLRHRARHADRLHPPAAPPRRGPALARHHLLRPHAAAAHRSPLAAAARRVPRHRQQVPPPHPRPPLRQPGQLRPLRLHARNAARLVLAGAMGRGTAPAPLGARAGLHGRAPRLPQRREPRLPRLVDPPARRARPLPRPARAGAAAPARVGQPAALHLLHDLRPEDHARRTRRAPGLRRLRRRACVRPAARGVRAQSDHLGAVPLRSARPPSRLVRGDPRAHKGATMRRALLLAFALTFAPRAHAFCGFFVGKADAQLFNKSSQVALVRDGDRTVLTMSNDYQGPLSEFALVVPVPSVLKREQIHIGDRKLLERLDAYSSPRLVEYTDPDPCAMRAVGGGIWPSVPMPMSA